MSQEDVINLLREKKALTNKQIRELLPECANQVSGYLAKLRKSHTVISLDTGNYHERIHMLLENYLNGEHHVKTI